MSDMGDRNARTALALMRMALALLDRAGATLTAARLQHAIDTAAVEGLTAPAPPDPEMPADVEEGCRDRQRHDRKGEGEGS